MAASCACLIEGVGLYDQVSQHVCSVSHHLGVPHIVQGMLDAVAAGAAVGGALGDGQEAKTVREALAWLACTYQGLLKVREDRTRDRIQGMTISDCRWRQRTHTLWDGGCFPKAPWPPEGTRGGAVLWKLGSGLLHCPCL
jgi:hypothetical protein